MRDPLAPVRTALSWRTGGTDARLRFISAVAAAPIALALTAGVLIGALSVSLGVLLPVAILAFPAGLAIAVPAARRALEAVRSVRRAHSATWLYEKLEPLRLEVDGREPRRIDLIHPTLDTSHFFGGYIAIFNLAARLAARGHRVRVIALEGEPPDDGWRRRVGTYQGIGSEIESIELEVATDRSRPVRVNPADRLIATHWTAAHVAAVALDELEAESFLYLVQEYEPFIFPMSSAAALARASYDLPHTALFSTDLLRDWFARERIGTYTAGSEAGERRSTSFSNAITPVGPVDPSRLDRPGPRRLLVYARPEDHASRNMFEVAVMALDRACAGGAFEGWELAGIGTVGRGGSLTLPGSGRRVELLPRVAQDDYARRLARFDVGLALMYTPHPSLVPIEMAAAGMATVTNTFANKDAEALAAISPNLVAARPDLEGVAAALALAEAASADLSARAEGSRVAWPSSWDQAMGPDVMEGVERLLGV